MYQSPRPAWSLRRCRNQPSSRTYRSTPSAAAASASSSRSRQPVVEVDRLPDVQHDGPGLAGPRAGVVRAGTEPGVERRADAVQAGVRVGGEEPRRLVRAAGFERDFGRTEQFGGADHGPAVTDRVHEALMVSAPAQVHGPDLAVPVAEVGGPGGQQERGVVAGASVPAGANPGALPQREPLGVGLPAPAAGEVQDFRGGPAHRQGQSQLVHGVAAGAVVGQRVPQLHQPAVVDPDLGPDRDPGGVVGLRDDGRTCRPAFLNRRRDSPKAGREGLAGAVAAEAGTSAPARRALRDQSERHRDVQGRRRDGRPKQGQVREDRAQVGAEVQHSRLAGAEIDQ